jgi:hypothetical protein
MASYYVDNDIGDDGDTGGSGDPFATINKALTSLSSGTSKTDNYIYIKYTGTDYDESSLSIDYGVTIQQWGTGTRPTIKEASGSSFNYFETGSTGAAIEVAFDSIIIDGNDLTAVVGINKPNTDRNHDIYITNCDFIGISDSGAAWGFYYKRNSSYTNTVTIQISDCLFDGQNSTALNHAHGGVYIEGYGAHLFEGYIQDCEFRQFQSSGSSAVALHLYNMEINAWDDWKVQRCKFYDNARAIQTSSKAGNMIFQNCLFHDNEADTMVFQVTDASDTFRVLGNTFYNPNGVGNNEAFIFVDNLGGVACTSNIIYGNIFNKVGVGCYPVEWDEANATNTQFLWNVTGEACYVPHNMTKHVDNVWNFVNTDGKFTEAMFTDTSSDDFTLKTSVNNLAVGMWMETTYAPSDDIDGNTRTADDWHDCGCYVSGLKNIAYQVGRFPTAGYSGIDDTYIEQAGGTHGSDTTILVSRDSGWPRNRILLRPDYDSLPAGTVKTAWWLITNTGAGGVDLDIDIYPVRSGRDWVDSQATYSIYKTGNSWGTAGCENTSTDRYSTNERTTRCTYLASQRQPFSFLTSYGNDDGQGFLFKSTVYTSGTSLTYASCDNATVAYRPLLVIGYEPPTLDTTTLVSEISLESAIQTATLASEITLVAAATLDTITLISEISLESAVQTATLVSEVTLESAIQTATLASEIALESAIQTVVLASEITLVELTTTTLASEIALESAIQTTTLASEIALESAIQTAILTSEINIEAGITTTILVSEISLESVVQTTTLVSEITLESVVQAAILISEISLESVIQAATLASEITLESVVQAVILVSEINLEAAVQAAVLASEISLESVIQAVVLASEITLESVVQAITLASEITLESVIQAAILASEISLESIVQTVTLISEVTLESVIQTITLASEITLESIVQATILASEISLESSVQAVTLVSEISLESIVQTITLVSEITLESIVQATILASEINLESAVQAAILASEINLESVVQTIILASEITLESIVQAITLASEVTLESVVQAVILTSEISLESVVQAVVLASEINIEAGTAAILTSEISLESVTQAAILVSEISLESTIQTIALVSEVRLVLQQIATLISEISLESIIQPVVLVSEISLESTIQTAILVSEINIEFRSAAVLASTISLRVAPTTKPTVYHVGWSWQYNTLQEALDDMLYWNGTTEFDISQTVRMHYQAYAVGSSTTMGLISTNLNPTETNRLIIEGAENESKPTLTMGTDSKGVEAADIDHITIRRLHLTGPSGSTSNISTGLDFSNVDDLIIDSVLISSFGTGVNLDQTTTSIYNSIIYRNYEGVITDNNDTTSMINCTFNAMTNNAVKIGDTLGGVTGTIKNSIITNSGIGISLIMGALAISYSDVFKNALNFSGISNQIGLNNNISVDPQYEDESSDDYRLKYGTYSGVIIHSPCIDTGTSEDAPIYDVVGNDRPL